MACELSLAQVVEAAEGRVLATVEKNFVGVGTDTRQALDNQIFVALKGDQYDAHQFLSQAVQKGAKCLLVHDEKFVTDELKQKATVVLVKDTLRGLQDLARYWRKQVKAKIFAVTGSSGKTTTKEFAAAILGTQFKVHYSRGSYNNHWGVPITILGISRFHEVAIVEMGMNHPGELTLLSKIAQPDVVICTTVGRAHIGHFGGSVQAVADAKEEIYLANPKATKIFNYDNSYTLKMFERVSKLQGAEKTVAFSSFSAGSEVSLRATHINIDGLQITGHITGVKGEARVPVFGRHNVVNLMAAASMAVVMNMEPERIWAAFPRCQSEWGRGQLVKLEDGATVLFDAYNANPDSMAALIKSMFEMNVDEGARKLAVLGEMLELGDQTAHCHEELGELIGRADFDLIWFMGPSQKAFEAGVKKSEYSKELILSENFDLSLAQRVRSLMTPKDIVIMKASRGMKLERVLEVWSPKFSLSKKN